MINPCLRGAAPFSPLCNQRVAAHSAENPIVPTQREHEKPLKACLVPVFIRLHYALIEELRGSGTAWIFGRNVVGADSTVWIIAFQSSDNKRNLDKLNAEKIII